MGNGTNKAALTQALDAHRLRYAKRGLISGILSGMTWGLQGVLLYSFALVLAPFAMDTYGLWMIIIASLAGACLHDFFASLWVLLLNGVTGRIREIPRALKTRPGRLAILASIFGGPIGMGGYIAGISLTMPTYAAAISAIYPAVGALLGRLILKERISSRVWLGIIACMAGAFVVGFVPPEGGDYPYFYLGIALSFLPAIGWAIEGVVSTYGMDMIDPDIAIWIREFFSGGIAFFTTLLLIPLVISATAGGVAEGVTILSGWNVFFSAFAHLDAMFWVVLAACAGGYSYVFWYRALNMVGTGRAMAFNVTYALWSIPFGALAGFITGHSYILRMNMVVGALIITLGTILVVVNPKELLRMRDVN